MSARKFVTGDGGRAYTAGPQRQRVVTKTVRYKCGCEVNLGGFGKQDAPMACEKHHEPIEEIVTNEKFLDP